MKKAAALLYGGVCYVMFLVAFLYAIGFVGNIVVPKSIDSGAVEPFGRALVINLLLLGVFGLQHSIMARPGFKAWWTKIVPVPVERSTYVLLTNAALGLIFWQWRPMPGVVWEIGNAAAAAVLMALFWAGWAIVLITTWLIDHFDLFGLRQVMCYASGTPYHHPRFRVTGFYHFVRHPLLLGFLVAFWATPRMTVGHLLFAVVTTLYMLVAIRLEETDLQQYHGPDYIAYQQRVPMLLPLGRKR